MKLDFSKLGGLIPVVVQDYDHQDILMVGFMNEEAWEKTKNDGYLTFFSRTRNKLWMKGEESGNKLKVLELLVDCDYDTLLIKVTVEGKGVVCHTGERSCFKKVISI